MADVMMAGGVADMAEAADSITVPKSVLGAKQCKPGDTLNFTVTDVDPETGDAEVELAGYSHKSNGNAGATDMGDDMASYPMEG